MLDNLLVALHSLLQVAYPQRLVVAVSHENGTWTIEVLDMISRQIWYIRSIFRNNRLETCPLLASHLLSRLLPQNTIQNNSPSTPHSVLTGPYPYANSLLNASPSTPLKTASTLSTTKSLPVPCSPAANLIDTSAAASFATTFIATPPSSLPILNVVSPNRSLLPSSASATATSARTSTSVADFPVSGYPLCAAFPLARIQPVVIPLCPHASLFSVGSPKMTASKPVWNEEAEKAFIPSPSVSSPTTYRSMRSSGLTALEARREVSAVICATTEALASTEPRPLMRVEGEMGAEVEMW